MDRRAAHTARLARQWILGQASEAQSEAMKTRLRHVSVARDNSKDRRAPQSAGNAVNAPVPG